MVALDQPDIDSINIDFSRYYFYTYGDLAGPISGFSPKET